MSQEPILPLPEADSAETSVFYADHETDFPTTDMGGTIMMVLLFIWIVVIGPVVSMMSWVVDQFTQLTGGQWPDWQWPLVSLAQGVFLVFPLLFLSWKWPRLRYQAVFRTWGLGALFIFFMLPLRFVSQTATHQAAIAQIVLGWLFVTFLLSITRRYGYTYSSSAFWWPAFLLAPIVTYSWFFWTTVGSPLDLLLNLLAALVFGWAVALIIGHFLLVPLYQTLPSPGWNVALGGFVVGVLLLLMSIGFSFQGMVFLLPFLLPALGWCVMMVSRWGSRLNWQGAGLFVGLVLAVPMILLDPNELVLALGLDPSDMLAWAFQATFITVGSAWLLGGMSLFWRRRLPIFRNKPILMSTCLVTWSVGLGIYFFVGQPGFYGDQLFVILNDQANISSAATIENRDERLHFVYQTLTTHAEQSQKSLRGALDQFGFRYQPYYLVNAVVVEGGPFHRWWLESHPDVARVLENPVLRPLPEIPPSTAGDALPPSDVLWNLTLIGADRVWDELGIKGEGIVIGQSDSGVQGGHPELSVRYRGRDEGDHYNWFDPWNYSKQPMDIGGHGTHTLGSILGQNTGVAPEAEWFGCVNLARNLANPALYLDCMQFMLAPFPQGGDPFHHGDPTKAAHVLNNSWGCPELEGCDPNALLPAVRALRAAGIFVVASAGNEGDRCSTVADPIALYDEVFSVGAVDSSGTLASFSSRGPVLVDGSERIKPDIVAPGVEVLSAYPNNTYAYADGTSMAGPHVAGVVALMWSANPDLIGDIERTEQILIDTTQSASFHLPSCGEPNALPNNAVGYGLVDAYAAVKAALK